ncbi:hypothetical protein [Salipiger sp. CCB-MM3]
MPPHGPTGTLNFSIKSATGCPKCGSIRQT